MTLAECKKSNVLYITAEDAGQILGWAPQAIRLQAQNDPKKLGFPVSVVGTRVRIPRIPFIEFWEGTKCEC